MAADPEVGAVAALPFGHRLVILDSTMAPLVVLVSDAGKQHRISLMLGVLLGR